MTLPAVIMIKCWAMKLYEANNSLNLMLHLVIFFLSIYFLEDVVEQRQRRLPPFIRLICPHYSASEVATPNRIEPTSS